MLYLLSIKVFIQFHIKLFILALPIYFDITVISACLTIFSLVLIVSLVSFYYLHC